MSAQESLFSKDDREYFYQVFPNEYHEVREGITTSTKVRWFVYLKRDVIQTILDTQFFGEWSDEYHSHRDMNGYSEVYCRITIRGLHREYNGSNTANSEVDEHQGKGAATDAFRRCASKWGIGLYLQNAIAVWTDYDYKDGKKIDYKKRAVREKEALQQVYKWLDSMRKGQPQPSNVTELQQPEPEQHSAPQEQYTENTQMVVTKLDKNQKPFITIEQCTFFTREPFRQLGYDDTTIKSLAEVGVSSLPDAVRIAYTVNDKGFREPQRVLRVNTGEVVDLNELKETA